MVKQHWPSSKFDGYATRAHGMARMVENRGFGFREPADTKLKNLSRQFNQYDRQMHRFKRETGTDPLVMHRPMYHGNWANVRRDVRIIDKEIKRRWREAKRK